MSAQVGLPGLTTPVAVDATDWWSTPEWVLREALGHLFSRQDVLTGRARWCLDPCSNPKAPSLAYCDRSIMPPDDGLAVEWYGDVWCNPPYSDPLPWVQRALDTLAVRKARSVTFLVPLGRGAQWDDLLMRYSAGLVPLGRVRFVPPDGLVESSTPWGAALYFLTPASVASASTSRPRYERMRSA